MEYNDPFNTYFDKIFIINLDERTDRWNDIVNEFEKMGISPEKYERFSAIKPKFEDLPKEWYNKLVSPHRFIPQYIQATIGCKMSQYEVIKIAKNRGYKNVLICEDDICFTQSKEETWNILKEAIKELPSDNEWNMFYFSGNHIKSPEACGKKYLYLKKANLAAHEYCVNSNIFDYIIETMMQKGCELDNYYIDEIQQRQKTYTIKPGIVTQKPGYSDILRRNVDFRNVIS